MRYPDVGETVFRTEDEKAFEVTRKDPAAPGSVGLTARNAEDGEVVLLTAGDLACNHPFLPPRFRLDGP